MCKKHFMAIDEIINQINSNNYQKDYIPNPEDELLMIVGDDKYPSGKNTAANTINFYKNNNFSEVAFLTKDYKLCLLSVLSILFDSTDRAVQMMQALNSGKVSDVQFAKYLLASKNMILVNNNNHTSDIKNILNMYKNHKILIIGEKAYKAISVFANQYIYVPHCAHMAYSQSEGNCLETYFSHSFNGIHSKGNVALNDFII